MTTENDDVEPENNGKTSATVVADPEITTLKKDIKYREHLKEALKENENLKLNADAEKKKLQEKANTLESNAQAFKQKYAIAELKAQAVAQGLTDIDAVAMMDTSSIIVSEDGEVKGVAEVIANFKTSKPYLFGAEKKASSSSNAGVPVAASASRMKDAMTMTDDEWAVESQRAIANPHIFNF